MTSNVGNRHTSNFIHKYVKIKTTYIFENDFISNLSQNLEHFCIKKYKYSIYQILSIKFNLCFAECSFQLGKICFKDRLPAILTKLEVL